MLKVLQNSEQNGASPTKDWVQVRTSPKNPWVAMPLPLTLGSSIESDIYVNASTMRPVSKIMASHGGTLTLIDTQTYAQSNLDQLSCLGIETRGPYGENPDAMSRFQKVKEDLMKREIQVYHGLSPWLRTLLPSSQNLRFIVVILAAMGAGVLARAQWTLKPSKLDLSETPLSVVAGNVLDLGIKSVDRDSSYAKGVTLALKDVEVSSSQLYVLTLSLSGLDTTDELTILFNDKVIGQTNASLSCSEEICRQGVHRRSNPLCDLREI